MCTYNHVTNKTHFKVGSKKQWSTTGAVRALVLAESHEQKFVPGK